MKAVYGTVNTQAPSPAGSNPASSTPAQDRDSLPDKVKWIAAVSACVAGAAALDAAGFPLGAVDLGLGAILASAAVIDAQTQRIPNRLVLPALGLGLVFVVARPLVPMSQGQLLIGGPGVFEALLGFVICTAFATLGFAMKVGGKRGLSGGDLKLLAVLGLMAGYREALNILLVALPLSLVWLVALAVVRGRLRTYGHYLWSFRLIASGGKPAPYPFAPTQAPFAVTLAAGALLRFVLPLDGFLPFP